MSRNVIAVSYGNLFLALLRNLHTVTNSGCIDLRSHQQCRRIPLFVHPVQNLLFIYFLVMMMASGRRYLVVVLVCIFLICSDVQCLFMCILDVYISLWRSVSLDALPILRFSYLSRNCRAVSSLDIPDTSLWPEM